MYKFINPLSKNFKTVINYLQKSYASIIDNNSNKKEQGKEIKKILTYESINSVPPQLINHIFSYINNNKDLLSFANACKKNYRIFNESPVRKQRLNEYQVIQFFRHNKNDFTNLLEPFSFKSEDIQFLKNKIGLISLYLFSEDLNDALLPEIYNDAASNYTEEMGKEKYKLNLINVRNALHNTIVRPESHLDERQLKNLYNKIDFFHMIAKLIIPIQQQSDTIKKFEVFNKSIKSNISLSNPKISSTLLTSVIGGVCGLFFTMRSISKNEIPSSASTALCLGGTLLALFLVAGSFIIPYCYIEKDRNKSNREQKFLFNMFSENFKFNEDAVFYNKNVPDEDNKDVLYTKITM